MSYIPLDIKALIIHEIWISDQQRERTLSGLCFAWPDTIPFIRQYRFKNLIIADLRTLSPLLDIIHAAPEISTIIRRINIYCRRGFMSADPEADTLALVSCAFNLEELVLDYMDLTKFNLAMAAFKFHGGSLTHLKTLSVNFSSMSTTSTLFDIIRSFPHLTTLRFFNLYIDELSVIIAELWDGADASSDFSPDVCIPWNVRDFEVPDTVSRITTLKVNLGSSVDLILLDLISSPKTPFPNVEEIILIDSDIARCRTQRLPALIERYNGTLRVLDLGVDRGANSTLCFPPRGYIYSLLRAAPVLTFPHTLEHFKFAISHETWLESFCQTLSSASVKLITVVISSYMGEFADTRLLDEVLAGVDSLERLSISVEFAPKDTVERGFPRCVKKHIKGGLELIWLGCK